MQKCCTIALHLLKMITKRIAICSTKTKQMKALSVKQPWPQLICTPRENEPSKGIKDIENRTWACPEKHIGTRVLIHASATEVKDGIDLVSCIDAEAARRLWFLQNDKKIHRSAIIGSVEIVDCVINHESIWAEKTPIANLGMLKVQCQPNIYNWILANPIFFPKPIPAKGKLSFWDYPNILAEPEEKNGELFCHCQLCIDEKIQVTGDSRFGYYCQYCGGKWYK